MTKVPVVSETVSERLPTWFLQRLQRRVSLRLQCTRRRRQRYVAHCAPDTDSKIRGNTSPQIHAYACTFLHIFLLYPTTECFQNVVHLI